MNHDHFHQFVFLFFVGLGVLTATTINLAMPQVGLLQRATTTGTSAAAAILGCWAFEGNSHLLGPLAISHSPRYSFPACSSEHNAVIH